MRRSISGPLLAVVLGGLVAGCGSGDDGALRPPAGPAATVPDQVGSSAATNPTTSTSSSGGSSGGSATTGPTAPVSTLPGATPARLAPVDAAAELAAVGGYPSLDLLASAIVASISQAAGAGEPGGPIVSSEVDDQATGGGRVVVDVDGLADDSLAGWHYVVQGSLGPQGWTVTSAERSASCRRGTSGNVCV